MSRVLEVEWSDFGVTVCVNLLDEENPKQCDEFWQALPFQTIFAASMSAGEMFKIPIPLILSEASSDKLRFFPDEKPGSLFMGAAGSLMLKYGMVAEPFRLPVIGRMTKSELEKFKSVAVKLTDAYFFTKEINIASLRRKG
jgi:hypothetical protein